MKPITDYQIVHSLDQYALGDKVKALLPEWQPYGPPVHHDGVLCQAMVAYEEEKE